MVCDTVDRVVLERDRVAKPVVVDDPDDFAVSARRLPLLGRAVPGLEIRVVDPDTFEERPERHVGELVIRGTSVTSGYYRRADATAALFHDDWLRTGDLAYQLDGELVLCGRIKDVIIVGGRNVFPEDIERAVAAVDGVRAGNVIAIGVDGYKGKESVVVVAEVRVAGAELDRTARPTCITARWRCVGSRHATSCSCAPARCRRRRRASCSGRSARSSTSTTTCSSPEATVMRAFASPKHRLHDPEQELESSAFQAPFENPQRAELIRAALVDHGGFEVVEPVEWGTAPIEAVHDPGLVRFLALGVGGVPASSRPDPRRRP